MNTHLRHLIQELRAEGWEYLATQTNGAPHFVHPQFGKVAVASTPADWEDECNYTRQRIRKAVRRHQDLPIAIPQANPLEGAFAEIDGLQRNLALLQDDAPRLLSSLQGVLQPLYARMVEERRQMVAAIGDALCSSRWKPRQLRSLEELCMLIVDTTMARLAVDLSKEFPFVEVLRKGAAQEPGEDEDFADDPFEGFDADAWESWFAEQESNTTYIPDPKKEPPKKPAKPKAKDVDAQSLGRKLYLGLARELHPDKTTLEEEREHRTHLMKQLNAAYSKGDLRTLLSILHLHGSESQRGAMDDATQAALLRALKEQRSALRAQIREAVAGLPEIEGEWLAVLSGEKQKEFFLRKERRVVESECQRLQEIRKEIQSSQGLAHLLKETDLFDWQRIF